MTVELTKLFTLSPLQPTYEIPADDNAMAARAFINLRNVHLLAFGGSGQTKPSLKTLADENWVYFSSTSAAPADEDTAQLVNWERSALIETALQVKNVPQGRQFLLKFQLSALGEHGCVRVAIDRAVQETHRIHQDEQSTLSLLLPVLPENNWVYIDVKHIRQSDGEASALRFRSVSCFLV